MKLARIEPSAHYVSETLIHKKEFYQHLTTGIFSKIMDIFDKEIFKLSLATMSLPEKLY